MFVQDQLHMLAQKLRVIQSNEMGFPSAIGNQCWSGLKYFAAKEDNESVHWMSGASVGGADLAERVGRGIRGGFAVNKVGWR